jgi:hypothetical protein
MELRESDRKAEHSRKATPIAHTADTCGSASPSGIAKCSYISRYIVVKQQSNKKALLQL